MAVESKGFPETLQSGAATLHRVQFEGFFVCLFSVFADGVWNLSNRNIKMKAINLWSNICLNHLFVLYQLI